MLSNFFYDAKRKKCENRKKGTLGRHRKRKKMSQHSLVGTLLNGNYLQIPKMLLILKCVYVDQKIWSKICNFCPKNALFSILDMRSVMKHLLWFDLGNQKCCYYLKNLITNLKRITAGSQLKQFSFFVVNLVILRYFVINCI